MLVQPAKVVRWHRGAPSVREPSLGPAAGRPRIDSKSEPSFDALPRRIPSLGRSARPPRAAELRCHETARLLTVASVRLTFIVREASTSAPAETHQRRRPSLSMRRHPGGDSIRPESG